MTYTPQPIDTSGVELPGELRELAETLARNTHDLWARRRMQEGWVHGPRVDAAAKTHPNLVPYEELSHDVQDYDRITALGVLRTLLALGFTISPPPGRDQPAQTGA